MVCAAGCVTLWLDGCVTPCVSVADGFPLVTADPVKAGAEFVPAGVPAVFASDNATAAEVVLAEVVTVLTAARLVPVPNVAGAVNL